MAELRDRARLSPEALQLIGIRGHLAVQQLDRHATLEVHVEGLVDRRHPSGTDLGIEPVPAAQLHAHQRAHELLRIVAEMAAPDVTIFTDPYSPWAWAAEPHLRRLEVEFGDQVRPSFVIVGLHRQISDPAAMALASVDASAASGMPVDPRVFLRDPPSSTHPAGLALHAVAEQTDVGAYLRRLQESIFLEGRRMDSAPALLDAAREVGGLNLDRLRIDFGSAAIMEAFAADLERAASLAAADGGLALEVDGRGVHGWAPYEQWRSVMEAAGFVASPARPGVEEAVRRWGSLATVEVAAACDLPLPRAAAELWRLALDWRVRARTVIGGVLWSPA